MASNNRPEIEQDHRPVPTVISSFPSYAAYVSATTGIDGDLQWLDRFLQPPWPAGNLTNLARVQNVDGKLQIATPSGETRLQELLGPWPPGVDSGMIFISYSETWDIDRQVLGAVGMKYELSPVHLFRHLYHASSWHDKLYNRTTWGEVSGLNSRQGPTRHLLPSEQVVEIQSISGHFALSVFEIHERAVEGVQGQPTRPMTTLVVFCRGIAHFQSKKSRLYPPPIMRYVSSDKTDNEKAFDAYLKMLPGVHKKTPPELDSMHTLLLPFFDSLAIDFVEALDDWVKRTRFSRSWDDLFHHMWLGYLRYRDRFDASHKSLLRMPQTPYRDRILADYDWLSSRIDQLGRDLEEREKQEVSMLSIRESRKSIKEAESVRRLSQLAFVFIPLSFVSSCFGMNLELLNSGNAQLKTFLAAAFGVTLGVILVSIGQAYFKKWGWRALMFLRAML